MRFLMFAAPAGGRRPLLALALSVLMLAAPLAAPPASSPAASRASAPTVVVIRDAETETLLRNFANPLFRAAGVEPNSVRIILIRDDALNAFVSTGNRLFINTGIIARSESALELVGMLAHEAGHIRGGHARRSPIGRKIREAGLCPDPPGAKPLDLSLQEHLKIPIG